MVLSPDRIALAAEQELLAPESFRNRRVTKSLVDCEKATLIPHGGFVAVNMCNRREILLLSALLTFVLLQNSPMK